MACRACSVFRESPPQPGCSRLSRHRSATLKSGELFPRDEIADGRRRLRSRLHQNERSLLVGPHRPQLRACRVQGRGGSRPSTSSELLRSSIGGGTRDNAIHPAPLQRDPSPWATRQQPRRCRLDVAVSSVRMGPLCRQQQAAFVPLPLA
eukprot:scaffold111638_cov33-Tisochrysis_lutea.AAC.3